MKAVDNPIHSDQRQNHKHYILGTAGHIDHGKTSLVRALTGTDTDRLPEEQRRGMTIELGFAELTLGDDDHPEGPCRFGIVDVPGHEKFIRTMVAGATGIDIGLLVVAADDSVMPQTIEHIEIFQLLGVNRGIVAVTKIDTVDAEMVELVIDDVKRLLKDSRYQVSAYCPVSSITGEGIENLKHAIHDTTRDLKHKTIQTPFRLPIDRVFTVQGRGTVVTGSALRGSVRSGDTLEVMPSGETCRVRDLQTHGHHCDSLLRGQRCAINISGFDRDRLQRGMELATPGYLQPSSLLDVRLECLSSYGRELKSSTIIRLELATTEITARVVLMDTSKLQPGESGFAQLRCSEPIATVYGQRFIIRDENAVRTIGGGTILRPVARRKRIQQQEDIQSLSKLESGTKEDRVEQVLTHAGFSKPSDLHLCAQAGVELNELNELYKTLITRKRWSAIQGTKIFVTPDAIEKIKVRLLRWLERFHQKNPQSPGRSTDSVLGWLERLTMRTVAQPLIDQFVKNHELKLLGRFTCLPAFAPKLTTADEKILAIIIDEYQKGGFQPPSIKKLTAQCGVDKKRMDRLTTLAVAMGEIIKIDSNIYLHTETQQQLRQSVADLIGQKGDVTVAQVREALGSSRKFVVPFLEYLDRVGYTRRKGDHRTLQKTDRHD